MLEINRIDISVPAFGIIAKCRGLFYSDFVMCGSEVGEKLLVAVEGVVIEAAEGDCAVKGVVNDGFYGDSRGAVLGEAVDAGADAWKGYGVYVVGNGEVESCGVA